MQRLRFSPPTIPASTDIIVGTGVLSEIPAMLQRFPGYRIAVVFDERVEAIARDVGSLCGANVLSLPLASGDRTKSLSEVDRLIGEMLTGGCSRQTLLIAVGGGMTTDLGGFLASVFMRGIPFLLVPTTSLAMVDAAIGGKTAVNSASRKNMAGTIAHPIATICDTSLLKRLPHGVRAEGFAETVKVALIVDAPFFEWLEEHIDAVISGDESVVEHCIARSIEAKLSVLKEDVTDSGDRYLLNFGHTVAHALESVSGYALSHGHAVSIGMVQELILVGSPLLPRLQFLLQRLSLPTELPAAWKQEEALWKAMIVDKKSSSGIVRIAVPTALGRGALRDLSRDAFHTLFL